LRILQSTAASGGKFSQDALEGHNHYQRPASARHRDPDETQKPNLSNDKSRKNSAKTKFKVKLHSNQADIESTYQVFIESSHPDKDQIHHGKAKDTCKEAHQSSRSKSNLEHSQSPSSNENIDSGQPRSKSHADAEGSLHQAAETGASHKEGEDKPLFSFKVKLKGEMQTVKYYRGDSVSGAARAFLNSQNLQDDDFFDQYCKGIAHEIKARLKKRKKSKKAGNSEAQKT